MSTSPPPLPPPQRHGCLTALLAFMLLANGATLLYYIFAGGQIAAKLPHAPPWIVYVLAAGCALNVVLTIAMFRWRKWAFYGCCVVAVATFGLNVSLGLSMIGSAPGLLGPVLLFAVLQIGGTNKGWRQLK